MIKTLRGQNVSIGHKRLYIEIRKPLGNVFSISDKIKEYMDKGYEVTIKVRHRIILLNKFTPYRQKEDLRPSLDIDHLSDLSDIRPERDQRPSDRGFRPLPLPGVDQRDREQIR